MVALIEQARQRLREAQDAATKAGGNVASTKAALARADAMHAEMQAEHDRLADLERAEVSAGASGLVAALKSGLMKQPEAPSEAVLKAKLDKAEAEHRLASIVLARKGLADEHEAAVEIHKRSQGAVHQAVGAVIAAHAAELAETVKAKAIELRDAMSDLNHLCASVHQTLVPASVFDASECASAPMTIRTERQTPSPDWSAFSACLASDAEAMP